MDLILRVLFRVVTLIFSPRPVVDHQGRILVIRSSWRTTLLTLGAVGRTVTIDHTAQTLRMDARIFWFFHRRRRIEFDWIASVFSTYHDLGGPDVYSHIEEDLFCVGLVLKDGSHITLFRYFGQGDFYNFSIWPDWAFPGENAVNRVLPHDMENQSASLAGLLEAVIRVPVTNDL